MGRILSNGFMLGFAAALAGASIGCGAHADASLVHTGLAPVATSDRAGDLCAGLSEVEQERPSFLRPEGIESIRPVTAERPDVKFAVPELRGAEIVLRPGTAVTKHWVVRVLRCHLADPVALALSGRFEDPLVVGAPAVSLDDTSDRVVLRIAGRDGAEGEEILRRAEQLNRSE
jgi:hypothetical protein